MIARAQDFILLDMFLYNAWQGPVRENFRALAAELTEALIVRKHERPALSITVISDPLNTAYGALESPHFEALQAAGIVVVTTDLTALQDSNPLYSGLWRWLIQPFGNGPGTLLPNPLGAGRVSLRSYLALANFKANHRKLLIADDLNGRLTALVTSANPHDGSSAHRNVALRFAGEAVNDLLIAEQAVLALSGSYQQLTDSSQATAKSDRHRHRHRHRHRFPDRICYRSHGPGCHPATAQRIPNKARNFATTECCGCWRYNQSGHVLSR